jgi:HPt (histidine-containing phosphotransfer) domain-containing protein
MTAKAMKEDRRECIRAGMDAYVSKPVRRDALEAVLREIGAPLEPRSLPPAETPPAVPADSREVFDLAQAMVVLEGDEELLIEIAQVFLDSSQSRLQEVRSSLAQEDLPAAHQQAHAIKGSLRNFGARRCLEAAMTLEVSASTGDLDQARAALEKLSVEIDLFQTALRDYLTSRDNVIVPD